MKPPSLIGLLFFASVAHAQITYPVATLQARPELAGFKAQGDNTLVGGKASVRLKLRGDLLESATITVEDGDTARAAALLGAVTGYGRDLAQPFAEYLERNAKTLTAAASIAAEEFTATTQVQGQKISVGIELTEVPASLFVASENAAGKGDEPVVVRVFSDFECPFCQSLENRLLLDFRKKLPDGVRFEFHHFPLESSHKNARSSAEASECAAEQGQFWAYHDALFTDRRWVTTRIPSTIYYQLADTLKLNMPQFRDCVQSKKYAAKITNAIARAGRLGLTGTPTVFVNGFKVPSPDAAKLARMIEFARR